MAFHTNYWTCSKFADRIRGTAKPNALSSADWKDWHYNAENKHPFRYYIAEKLLGDIQDIVTWPYTKFNSIRYYINNRWVIKSHALTANKKDIKPGDWQDVGNRFLPCMFNELVNFVEVELAWHNVCCDNEARKQFNPPWWRTSFFKWKTWRSAESGLANLEWQKLLKYDEQWVDRNDPNYGQPTPQAEHAKEIYKLYIWWTQIRPKRPNVYEETGWHDYCVINPGIDTDPRDTDKVSKMLSDMQTLEDAYEKEDEEMMIRLIKIRNSLWT